MRRFVPPILTLLVLALMPSPARAQRAAVLKKAEVGRAAKHDLSKPLRDIEPISPAAAKRNRVENPMLFRAKAETGQPDPAVQASVLPNVPVTGGLNFEGVGDNQYGFNVQYAPPDTTGDVGATQYVQWVNVSFAVFRKSDGLLVYGPAAGNTLWSGFGGPCEQFNDGDPIVQYDQFAQRWIMTQFAVPGGAAGYWQCVAVSQTSDATGAYHRYAFQYNQFPDFPKLSVWPDAYYITFNMFASSFTGARLCAYDRAKMLAGLPATQQCFQLSTSYGSVLPADVDGPAPPLASPNYMLTDGTNSLLMWKFKVDWAVPSNTTLTGPTTIPVAAFSHPCPTTSRGACVPQPGTNQKLESLADRLQYRLAYRNFGTHESLVVTQPVNVGTTRKNVRTGIRWYELRNPNGAVAVHQQSTYAPGTADWRWMSSAAMDKQGNLAIGYSISNATGLRPSLRFAGRAAADPLNTLSSETNLHTGTGSQTQGLARWGDYATISVDPVDDCTMWYTNEYVAANGTFNWQTRIASFKLGTCQ